MTQKVRRNEPCPCGSSKKYKRCCGHISPSAARTFGAADFQHIVEKHQASERIRETQQGFGRPIISFKVDDHQIVAVRNRLFWSPKWKTFPDFLADYIKQILRPEWGNAELAKPFEERHPILQWYDTYCRYQQATMKTPGEVNESEVTGIVACYLGLAYSLYLLDHNVELQARLVRRLKNRGNFQGAYYELIVANALIRAGFTLTLEDETDEATKHCEFAAVSKRTGRRYWVEAKMRAVAGLLGRTSSDGTLDSDPLSRLIPHLNDALQKPAADERLIFIDLNAGPESWEGVKPQWHDKVVARLERYERKELRPGVLAYVFVTNVAFHHMLTERPTLVAVPFGLGMPDFNRPRYIRLFDAYRLKQRHADAHHIGDGLLHYLQFPATFDGSLPSETFDGRRRRVSIGEFVYFFEGIGEGGTIGTVTTATVVEREGQAYIGITVQGGHSQILTYPMSAGELADYRAHPDAYFGKIQPVGRTVKTPFEMFEWLMEANAGLSRAMLLEQLTATPNSDRFKTMSDGELLAKYCEAMTAAYKASGFVMD